MPFYSLCWHHSSLQGLFRLPKGTNTEPADTTTGPLDIPPGPLTNYTTGKDGHSTIGHDGLY